jgi:dihydrofolate reductase
MKFSIIVATDKNGVIGVNNKLPWYIPEDLKRFKKLTSKSIVIMGRKTFESIYNRNYNVLPERINIVIGKSSCFDSYKEYAYDDFTKVIFVNSIEDSIKFSQDYKNNLNYLFEKEIFIIGGGLIYSQFLSKNLIDRIFLTVVNTEVKGDVFFPIEYLDNFKCIKETLCIENKDSLSNLGYSFKEFSLK